MIQLISAMQLLCLLHVKDISSGRCFAILENKLAGFELGHAHSNWLLLLKNRVSEGGCAINHSVHDTGLFAWAV